ncbi:acyl carrier protein [Tychonema sp. LEGE 07203]|nr:acyl carrier protein [Tychonema sp. LEGE 07203]
MAVANLFHYFRVRDKSEEENVKDQIYEKVKALVANQLQIEATEVTVNTKFTKHLGADDNANFRASFVNSVDLNALQLILAFEETFDIEIPDEDAEEIKKVQQAVDYIYQKISTSATPTLTEESCASDNVQQKIPETTETSIEENSLAIKKLGLTLEETRIMFSYQYHLVQDDIDRESDYNKQSLKQEWLSEWQKSTTLFLNSKISSETPDNRSLKLIANFQLLQKFVQSHLICPNNQFTRRLVLLEVTLFQAYYSLGDSRDEAFKDLKIADEERLTSKLKFFAGKLEIDVNSVYRFKSNYKEAIKVIQGGINPLLIGAGGFGMAGGMAVIVAGGSILGASAGVGVGALFSQSPDTALIQAAKLEVVMREIVVIQKDIPLAQEILKQQRLAIRSIEDKLDDLLLNQQKNHKEIENLKRAIEYLKKALERNQGLI